MEKQIEHDGSYAPWLFKLGEERNERFEYDLKYMLKTVCNELKKKDKYKRGLVTAETFNDVLGELNLKYGSFEVDLIMRYCHVTDDGYVHYKYLLMEFFPPYKNLGVKDNVKEALCASEIMSQDCLPANMVHSLKELSAVGYSRKKSMDNENMADPLSLHILTPEKSETIRKLYAQWDRGMLKDHELFEYLKLLNIPISKEFERLICTHGPSRTLTFGKLMQCLLINNITNCQRKSRSFPSSLIFPKLPLSDQKNCFYDYKRNPITWNNNYHEYNNSYYFNKHEGNQKEISPRTLDKNTSFNDFYNDDQEITMRNVELQLDDEKKKALNQKMYLKRLVCDYLDNLLPSLYFRLELYKMNIKITNEIDSLIRQHDSDNQGNFTDFMKVLLKASAKINFIDENIVQQDILEEKTERSRFIVNDETFCQVP